MHPDLIALVTELAAKFSNTHQHLLSVESCTGGGLAYYCTELAGASAWYECGYVTYQDYNKLDLGVPAQVLRSCGAVSEQTALALAKAALVKHQALKPQNYFALAITGIAGPTGGSLEKPVGTVCFGTAVTAGKATSVSHIFTGKRREIREQALIYAVKLVLSHS